MVTHCDLEGGLCVANGGKGLVEADNQYSEPAKTYEDSAPSTFRPLSTRLPNGVIGSRIRTRALPT